MNTLFKHPLILAACLAALPLSAAVQNPSFESASVWESPSAKISFTPDGSIPAYDGSKVALTGAWPGGGGTYLTQATNLPVEPGREYVLSAQYAPRGFEGTSFGGVWLRLIAAGPSGRHTVAMRRATPAVTDWTRQELRWQAPTNLASVPVLHGLTGEPTGQTANLNGTSLEVLVGQTATASPFEQAYIDAVQLVASSAGVAAAKPSPAPTVPAPDRKTSAPANFSLDGIGDYAIPNAGFEQSGIWNTVSAHESFAPDGQTLAKEGRKYALVGGWAGDRGLSLDQVTDVSIQPGGSYRLSAWFAPRKEGESTFGGVWMRLIANAPSGRHTVALFKSTAPVDDWTPFTLDWVAPVNLSAVPTLHGLTGAPTGETADITNAKLEILVGRPPEAPDAYKQSCIDLVRLQGPGGNARPPVANSDDMTVKSDKIRRIFGPIPEEGQINGLDDMNVVWEEPGYSSKDSMPLGNGETALNVWTEPDGRIAFDIARTDAWSGLGRLLKLGRVHIDISPNPFTADFRQTLDLETATIWIEGADGFEARIWVDANHQAIRFDFESDQPLEVTAEAELLRPETRPLEGAESHSAYSMRGAPASWLMVEADTAVEGRSEDVLWYHRNGFSIWGLHFDNQGLGELKEELGPDPLLNRTFGTLMRGEGFQPVAPLKLSTEGTVRSGSLDLFTLTSVTAQAGDWIRSVESLADQTPTASAALTSHQAWWNEFWNRSWIRANGEKPDFLPAYVVVSSASGLNPVVGASQIGRQQFNGLINRAVYFERPASQEQIQELYQAGPGVLTGLETWPLHHAWFFDELQGEQIPNRGTLPPSPHLPLVRSGELMAEDGGLDFGNGSLTIPGRKGIAGELFRMGGSLEVWIRPEQGSDGGRIFDFYKASHGEGLYLESFGPDGRSLRAGRHKLEVEAENVLTPGVWQQVVVSFDAYRGELDLYVDGVKVGGGDLMALHEENAASGLFHLSQGYALQRFITACAGRGNFPIKFNGSLFTMDGPTRYMAGTMQHDPDFRMWGPDYWFQNTRLPYWPLIQSGDFDLMETYWDFYWDLLETAKAKTRIYYDHEGAYFPETITFWGTFNMQNYGWPKERQGNWSKLAPEEDKGPAMPMNAHIRYYWDGMLEFITMMLDYYAVTQDDDFLNERILPFAREIVTFYEQHYEVDNSGELYFFPAQAMESYQFFALKVENPANVIGGLRSVLPRLETLTPESEPELAALWSRVFDKLPALPINEESGVIKAAANRERAPIRGNGEEPGLYNVFPYQNYGLGRPDMETGLKTLAEVYPLYTGGWNQDAVFAGMLGQTEAATALTYRSFAIWNEGSRFPGFWGPNYDWVPDQDHGGTAVNSLQRMLLQPVDEAIHLFPAWPQDWDVDFKLHANYQTTVHAVLQDGRLVELNVEPESRRKDVVLPDWLGGERETPRNVAAEIPTFPGMPEPGPISADPRMSQANAPQPVDLTLAEPLRIFFSEAELPAIRQRLSQGRADELMDMLRGVAEGYLSIETEPYAEDKALTGRNLQAQIGILALVGHIDQKPEYLQKAREILLAAIRQFDVDFYHKANTHLAVGDAAVALAIAYDWVGPVLTEDEREAVGEELYSLGEYLYDASLNPHPYPFQKAHNHSVVLHNGLLFAGEVVGRDDWVAQATPWVVDFVNETQDGTGAPYEGTGYADYGLQHGMLATELLRRNHGRDLFDETDGLDQLQKYVLHLLYPWGGGAVPLGQTGSVVPGLSYVYYAVNRQQDEAGLYAWYAMLGDKGIPGLADIGHTSHFRMYPFLPLWTHNGLRPESPLQTYEPLSREFNRGIVSARTAWGDPEAGLLTFQSTRNKLGVWDHPDENTFTFSAFGDSLLVDPGPHIWASDSHGIILIDGTGYTFRTPGQRSQGELKEFEDRGNSVYMVGDAADAYKLDSFEKPTGLPVERAERRILFVRAKQPFAIVADRIEMEGDREHIFTWQANYAFKEFPNTAEIEGQSFTVTGSREGARARVDLLEPGNLQLSKRTVEGQNNLKAELITAESPPSETGEFLTLVTSASKNGKLPAVERTGNTIRLRFADGSRWQVEVSENDITARRL